MLDMALGLIFEKMSNRHLVCNGQMLFSYKNAGKPESAARALAVLA